MLVPHPSSCDSSSLRSARKHPIAKTRLSLTILITKSGLDPKAVGHTILTAQAWQWHRVMPRTYNHEWSVIESNNIKQHQKRTISIVRCASRLREPEEPWWWSAKWLHPNTISHTISTYITSAFKDARCNPYSIAVSSDTVISPFRPVMPSVLGQDPNVSYKEREYRIP